jgi:hypothetical protein
MPEEKKTNNNLQNTTQKTKDRARQTSLKTRGEPRGSRRVGSSCSTSGTRCITLVTNLVMSHEWEKDLESAYDKCNISVVICDTDIP